MIKYSGSNRQIAINMIASAVSFIVGVCINFFLTPYIVGALGAAAYGFVGLSNNLISYTQLLTIALNSMASRFVTISYAQGRIEDANKYFSSVFYANLVMSIIIVVIMGTCVFYIDVFFEIPFELIVDVKLLLSLLVFNTIIGLMTNIFAIATFIKNRLELASIRTIIGKIIQAVSTILLFGLLMPQLWYIGLAGMLVTIYQAYTNYRFTNLLTPELKVSTKSFDISKIKELISSGIWNSFFKLGDILGQGLDLIIANIFIGAAAMGVFSITKSIPVLIIQLFGTIAATFAPLFTNLYANKKNKDLVIELNKSIRILGGLSALFLSILFVFSKEFYLLWIPTQDAKFLAQLTILGCLVYIPALPLEPLWNIFTITNKLKYSTVVLFATNILIFLTVVVAVLFTDSIEWKLVVLASSRSIWGAIRTLVFLPFYGAYCLGVSAIPFIKNMLKPVLCLLLICGIGFTLKSFFVVNTWPRLLGGACSLCIIGLLICYFFILTNNDKDYILERIHKYCV